MLAADGLGGVGRGQVIGSRCQAGQVDCRSSLADSNPSQPGLSDEG